MSVAVVLLPAGVGGGDAGVDRGVAVGGQVAAGDVDAEGAARHQRRCRGRR